MVYEKILGFSDVEYYWWRKSWFRNYLWRGVFGIAKHWLLIMYLSTATEKKNIRILVGLTIWHLVHVAELQF
jgi:hypothetical protein